MHFDGEGPSARHTGGWRGRAIGRFGAFITAALAAFVLSTAIGGVSYAQVTPSIRIPLNHPTDIASLIPNAVSTNRPITLHITLKLHNRAGLRKLLREQQDPSSSEYHHWLQPDEFMSRFGPSPSEVAAVKKWLSNEGFKVSGGSSTILRAQGTVGKAVTAFGISFLGSADGRLYANEQDPAIPARFTNVISSIGGLDNLMAASPASQVSPASAPALLSAGPVSPGELGAQQSGSKPESSYGGFSGFAPADFYTFYGENSLLNSGTDGNTADCIAVIEDSDFATLAVDQFDSSFSLAPASITKVFADGSNPGYNGDESEALLDVEWAHAVAPNAPIRAYIGLPVVYVNGVQQSGLIDAANDAVQKNVCGSIDISFGFCGGSSSFYTQTINQIAQQAATQGQSVFISSGDWGAAGLVFNSKKGTCVVGSGRHVNEMAADPYVTAIGGSQFTPVYDGAGNDVGNVPEDVWDETTTLNGKKIHIGASGGGVSRFFNRPSYQAGEGVPDSLKRNLPDISIGAGVLKPGFLLFYDPYNDGVPSLGQAGGTSIGAAMWAGIANLIAQVAVQNGQSARIGNINPRLYLMGQQMNGSATGIRDVTSGNNSFHSVAGFPAGLGYDRSTGWGTVDLGEFVPAFVTGDFVTVAGDLGFYPHQRHFPRQLFSSVGTTSPVRKVFIINHNRTNLPAAIDSVSASGDFNIVSDGCMPTLAARSRCEIGLTFQPSAVGPLTGTLTVSGHFQNSPLQVPLLGKAVPPHLKYGPYRLRFGRVTVGTPSATKTVTLTNRSDVPIDVSSIVSSSADFAETNDCSAIAPQGGQCTISVTFTPSIPGGEPATLSITDDAQGGTQIVHLAGRGE